MSEGRKRCRKSKLEVRDDDCDYEVVSENNDETPPLQKIPKLNSLPPHFAILDHDYCKRGSQGYAYPHYPTETKKSIRGSTIIAVQQTQGPSGSIELSVKVEAEQFDAKGDEMALFPETQTLLTKRKSRVTGKHAIKMCKYDPEALLKSSSYIAANSNNPADRLLDIEMRNMWGNVLYTPEKVDDHEAVLQIALDSWQLWYTHSKIVRESPLFYQCHICELAWWRLQPFRDHIKMHDMKSLKVSFKENVHEGMIIASHDFVDKLKFFDIADVCWRCGNDLAFHKDSSKYACSRCFKSFYTCSAFSDHESTCLYRNIIKFNVNIDRQCTICKKFMDCPQHLESHMVIAHSVRSDQPVSVAYKICTHCECKYFVYSTHNCTRSPKNSGCDHCCRKFATKTLAIAHISSKHNTMVKCKICAVQIETKCQEMEHLLKHSYNYDLAYKCTICSNQYLLFIDEMSIAIHRRLWHHQKKFDRRRAFYEKMLVPKHCLEEGVAEALEPDSTQLPTQTKRNNTDSTQLPTQAKRNSTDEVDFDIKTTFSEQLHLDYLSANVNVTVDEVDIKKEPLEYSENGEIDYEVMLHKMFNESSGSPSKNTPSEFTKDPKTNTENPRSHTEDPKISTQILDSEAPTKEIKIEFDFKDVKIKSEPLDEIEIVENPVETVIIKTEPVDDSQEYREYQSQNVMYMEYKTDSEKQKQEKNQEQENKQNQENGSLVSKREVTENQKCDGDIKNQKNESKSKNKKIIIVKKNNLKIVKKQISCKSSKIKKLDLKNRNQEIDEIETLTVKVEPDIDMDDIQSENIVIKNEVDDDLTADDISTESIPFGQLITDLNLTNETLNPDEMSFDIINPGGIYKKKKVYACHKCGYTAQYKQYRTHVASKCSVSPGINGSYPCSKCGLTFVMFRNYVLHFDTHGYELMACPKCSLVFDTLLKLLSHVHKHIKNNFVGLHVLDRGGEESTRLKKQLKCQECREVILQRDSFIHWESHLSVKKAPVKTVPEPIIDMKGELTVDCERVTMNNKTLDKTVLKQAVDHLQSINVVEKECVICYRAFSRRYDVKRHIVEHLLMDAHMNKYKHKCFRCQICFEGFQHQEQYKFHMREHGSMPIFKCELCNKTFSDSSNFAKHKKTHNVRVLVCDLCNKKFHAKSALEKHIADHMNLPKTKCAFCEKTFISKQNYKRHKYQVHVKNKYKCILCDIKFTSLQHKWNHNWEVHKERKQNADCPICLKSFRKFQDVRVHARAEHRAEVHPIKQGRGSDLQYYKVKGLKKVEQEQVNDLTD